MKFVCGSPPPRVTLPPTMHQTAMLQLIKSAASGPMTPINTWRSISEPAMRVSGGIAGTVPFLPWNTAGAVRDKLEGNERQGEMGQSLVTDAGRGLGAALGAGTVKGLAENWHIPQTSNLARMALILGGMGVGSFLGQRQGKQVGQDLFPSSLADRLRRATSQI